MASVKINELPSIAKTAANDVLIINDTSDSTTKKTTLENYFSAGLGVAFINCGLTAINGITALDSQGQPAAITAEARVVSPYTFLLHIIIPSGTRLVNTSSSTVRASFDVTGINNLSGRGFLMNAAVNSAGIYGLSCGAYSTTTRMSIKVLGTNGVADLNIAPTSEVTISQGVDAQGVLVSAGLYNVTTE